MNKWSLCIATLNRQDALIQTIACARTQTCPPSEIVVIDVSNNWEESRAKIQQELKNSDIRLKYETLGIRSLSMQRNAGISKCENEIIFLLDDDSFMFSDCAERILKIYASDPKHEIACVSARLVPDLPPECTIENTLERYHTAHSGNAQKGQLKYAIYNSRPGDWFIRKVLLHNKDENFIRYEGDRRKPLPSNIDPQVVVPLNYMPGSAMTVRRAVAQKEPFDTALRYYAAGEDADATYRFGRHGLILMEKNAKLHHYKAAGGRINRSSVIALGLLNMALFVVKNSSDAERFKRQYQTLLRRRFFAEFLKDLLSRRLSFPQVRGVVIAMKHWRSLWAQSPSEIEETYPNLQEEIISKTKA